RFVIRQVAEAENRQQRQDRDDDPSRPPSHQVCGSLPDGGGRDRGVPSVTIWEVPPGTPLPRAGGVGGPESSVAQNCQKGWQQSEGGQQHHCYSDCEDGSQPVG